MKIDHAKLKKDLIESMQIAERGAHLVPDGGSCNNDRPVLCDVRFTKKLQETIRDAGLSCYKSRWGVHLGVAVGGQGARHAKGVELFKEAMSERGYSMLIYWQMD